MKAACACIDERASIWPALAKIGDVCPHSSYARMVRTNTISRKRCRWSRKAPPPILLRETERIVAGRWPQIVAVAQALLARERLEALEIYRMIVAAR